MITMYEKERKVTPIRLSGAFHRVKEKLGLRKIANHRPGSAQFTPDPRWI
jgi:hypothetical protein